MEKSSKMARDESRPRPPKTVDELSRRFTKSLKGTLKFAPSTNTWYSYRRHKWAKSRGIHLAKKQLNKFMLQRSDLEWKMAMSKLRPHMRQVIELLELDDDLEVDEADFDKNPWLLGVKNGVIDLRTGEFRDGRPTDMVTRQAGVDFEPTAECPTFRQFLADFTSHQADLRKAIRRVFGYLLTGDTSQQKFFLMVGPPGTGKGVLTRALMGLLGEYAVSIAPALLFSNQSVDPNKSSEAVMRLKGARMYLCSELKPKPFEEVFLKMLTGGDNLTARKNYGEQTEFKPVGKLVVSTNYDPQVAYDNKAIHRRLCVIPCPAKVPEVDQSIEDAIAAELPGILNYILPSARLYIKSRKLRKCDAVDDATAAFINRADSAAAWLAACCLKTKGYGRPIGAQEAHKSYLKFMKDLGRAHLGMPAFKKAMERLGYPQVNRSEGHVYLNLRLI